MVTALAPADGPDKAKLMAAFAVEGIDSRPMFHPLSSLPAYADADGSGNCTAYSLSPRGINLPSALCLERTQVDKVCTVFKKALAG
jgi:perosamine synthetase